MYETAHKNCRSFIFWNYRAKLPFVLRKLRKSKTKNSKELIYGACQPKAGEEYTILIARSVGCLVDSASDLFSQTICYSSSCRRFSLGVCVGTDYNLYHAVFEELKSST